MLAQCALVLHILEFPLQRTQAYIKNKIFRKWQKTVIITDTNNCNGNLSSIMTAFILQSGIKHSAINYVVRLEHCLIETSCRTPVQFLVFLTVKTMALHHKGGIFAFVHEQ